jgi:hypothetical protein
MEAGHSAWRFFKESNGEGNRWAFGNLNSCSSAYSWLGDAAAVALPVLPGTILLLAG